MDVIAAGRVAGKPYTVTEVNYFFPNDASAEAPLVIAAYTALQDIDGVFLFNWGYNGLFDASDIREFTDLDNHPHGLANFPVAANLFRRFDVSPAETVWTVAMDPVTEVETLQARGEEWRTVDASFRDFPMAAAAMGRVEMDVSEAAVDSEFPDLTGLTELVSDTGELTWNHTDGFITMDTARTRAVTGFTDGLAIGLGGPGVDCLITPNDCVVFEPGYTLSGWSALALSMVEGESFAGEGRALLSATGLARNTGMAWTDETRTSLGDQWGGPPSRVEAIPGTVTLPRPSSGVRVFALDEQGQRIAEIPVTGDAVASFQIGADAGFPTLWYEVSLGGADPAGEGSAGLDQCGAYCDAVAAALTDCYADRTECLEDCATWRVRIRGARCDCAAEADALFECAVGASDDTRVCGRLAQGVPPAFGCVDAYTDAARCAGNRSPCTDWVYDVVDDFEDGDDQVRDGAWGAWDVQADGATTLNATVPDAHGAGGSFYAAHLEGDLVEWGWITLWQGTANPVDLSDAVGIAFAAKGTGAGTAFGGGNLRVDLVMEGVESDQHGMSLLLTPWWTYHTVLFDDMDFGQQGFGQEVIFDPTQIIGLSFTPMADGPFELWIDDVAMLRAP
jgi:hypothetical protein